MVQDLGCVCKQRLFVWDSVLKVGRWVNPSFGINNFYGIPKKATLQNHSWIKFCSSPISLHRALSGLRQSRGLVCQTHPLFVSKNINSQHKTFKQMHVELDTISDIGHFLSKSRNSCKLFASFPPISTQSAAIGIFDLQFYER